MAFLGIGKKKKESGPLSALVKQTASSKLTEEGVIGTSRQESLGGVFPIIRPRMTEKATALQAAGVYCFDVLKSAGKRQIAEAIRSLYNVSPVKVRVVKVPGKQVFSRGKHGYKSGGKKAYVFLKEGEKIEIV